MQKTLSLFDTSIGKKAIVAVTGLILYGFVIVHMLGNLQVFLGPEKFNHYAETLKATPPLLWGTRFTLIIAVALHVSMSLSLVATSAAARPVGYRLKQQNATNYGAITMRYGGPTLLLFILYHLAHFTFPGVAMGHYAHSHTDPYRNFVNGFSVPWVAGIYLIAQFALGLHLYHGSWSMLQTLGLNHPRYQNALKLIPRTLGIGVPLGNSLMVLSVLAGVIR